MFGRGFRNEYFIGGSEIEHFCRTAGLLCCSALTENCEDGAGWQTIGLTRVLAGIINLWVVDDQRADWLLDDDFVFQAWKCQDQAEAKTEEPSLTNLQRRFLFDPCTIGFLHSGVSRRISTPRFCPPEQKNHSHEDFYRGQWSLFCRKAARVIRSIIYTRLLLQMSSSSRQNLLSTLQAFPDDRGQWSKEAPPRSWCRRGTGCWFACPEFQLHFKGNTLSKLFQSGLFEIKTLFEDQKSSVRN